MLLQKTLLHLGKYVRSNAAPYWSLAPVFTLQDLLLQLLSATPDGKAFDNDDAALVLNQGTPRFVLQNTWMKPGQQYIHAQQTNIVTCALLQVLHYAHTKAWPDIRQDYLP